jgi:hypothetical protein
MFFQRYVFNSNVVHFQQVGGLFQQVVGIASTKYLICLFKVVCLLIFKCFGKLGLSQVCLFLHDFVFAQVG